MNRGEVYFLLSTPEDFDPDIITAQLGIEPTGIVRRAEPRPRMNAWRLSSGTVQDDPDNNTFVDIYPMARSVIDRLAPRADTINVLMNQYGLAARLQVVLYISWDGDDIRSAPPIGFDEATVAFLAKVGAYIDVDSYKAQVGA
ncbi:DUF4279 domain-containing protein [Lysobacter brunescens]|uniref:DUF4279 domain-containing protein n=1 Tax=Lysobacter brunescens TaxID=262323 RepID=A0ABW2YG66_9GAMM